MDINHDQDIKFYSSKLTNNEPSSLVTVRLNNPEKEEEIKSPILSGAE